MCIVLRPAKDDCSEYTSSSSDRFHEEYASKEYDTGEKVDNKKDAWEILLEPEH